MHWINILFSSLFTMCGRGRHFCFLLILCYISGEKALSEEVQSSDLSHLTFKNGSTISRPKCSVREGVRLVGLSTTQILRLNGHKTETHYVTTYDGYILEIHRIPAPGKPVVYVLPGILQSSRDLVLNCKKRSIASKLAAAGYDVWLGNFRGNIYGRNHSNMSPDSRQFWKFSWDQLYQYDGPAATDYILGVTGESKLNWVGFSLGNAELIGMLSLKPEYNKKINVAVAMGPAIFLGNMKSLPFRLISPIRRAYESLAFLFIHGEVPPPFLFKYWQRVIPKICEIEGKFDVPAICSFIFELIDGKNVEQINLPYLPAIFSTFPSPFSARTMAHWFQLIRSGKFEKFSYGRQQNLKFYGSQDPPSYDLNNVKVPILAMWGANDYFTTPKDVRKVIEVLPNVIEDKRIELDSWNHLDFIYAKDADIFVYDYIVEFLARFNKFN